MKYIYLRSVERNQIDQMIEKERLHLTFWDYLKYNQFSIFAIFVLILIAIAAPWNQESSLSMDTFKPFLLPFLLVAVVPIVINHVRLKFTKILGQFTEAEFNEAIDRTCNEMGCYVNINTSEYVKMQSFYSTLTLIRTKNYVLYNCIGGRSFLENSNNKKLEQAFKIHLLAVKSGKSILTYVYKDENQWSIRRIIIRLIAYIAFLIPIYMTVTIPGAAFMLVISLLCSYYIYIDAKLIIRQLKGISPKE